MKRTVQIIILLFGCIINSQHAYSAETNKEEEAQPLDLIIILDDGEELTMFKETKKTAAARQTLSGAIRDEIPFLVSNTVLAALSQEYAYLFKYLQNSKQWKLYVDKTHEFTIGLPVHYLTWEKIITHNEIQQIGLNKSLLFHLQSEKINDFYFQIFQNAPSIKQVNLTTIKHLFAHKIGDTWESINNSSRKRLILFGHGLYEKKNFPGFIASLTIADYRDFLQFLNVINVDLLYVVSCYSGGNNLLKTYQLNDELISKPISLNYFLIIGAVTDNSAAAVSTQIDFIEFFQMVDNFFAPKKSSNVKFGDVAKLLWGKIIHNIPSVRFPGSINYFKAIEIDKYLEVITYAKSTALTIPPRLLLPIPIKNAYHRILDAFRKNEQPITEDIESVEKYLIEETKTGKIKPPTPIETHAKTIVIYPMQLKTPLIINFPPKKFTAQKLAELELGKYPAFISMIPGTAAHLINSVTTQGSLDLRYFIYMFFTLESAFAKLFLIEHLLSKNYPGSGIEAPEHAIINLTNVAIFKNKKQNSGTVFVQFDNKQYKAEVVYKRRYPDEELDVMPSISPFTVINAQQAHKEIYELIIKTRPTQQAVSQASGGQENEREIMEKMLSIFVPSIPH
ncbi:MAG: hypothetical protein BWY54_00137 [Candidatus Dependentiae bacterium ADurb.Bin331]|nr:MAG: hypothetical protein BWY54_00137 [Candidatus Dependentiae bacterium ADurb.Bin331]